jgi:hypothetical protein
VGFGQVVSLVALCGAVALRPLGSVAAFPWAQRTTPSIRSDLIFQRNRAQTDPISKQLIPTHQTITRIVYLSRRAGNGDPPRTAFRVRRGVFADQGLPLATHAAGGRKGIEFIARFVGLAQEERGRVFAPRLARGSAPFSKSPKSGVRSSQPRPTFSLASSGRMKPILYLAIAMSSHCQASGPRH